MGDARRKQLKAKDEAVALSPYCIFCGGTTPATTGDHYPPRAMFIERRYPEGYCFPACGRCNSGSRGIDKFVSFLARMNSGPHFKYSDEEIRKTASLKQSLEREHPALLQEMFGLGAVEKKAFARRIGYELPKGKTSRDLPFMRVPPLAQMMLKLFGAKLAKAVHFKHTGRIVPSGAAVLPEFQGNAAAMVAPFPDELLSSMTHAGPMKSATIDLSPQFSYLYSVTADGAVASYVFRFAETFQLLVLLNFDAAELETLIREASAEGLLIMRSPNPAG